MNEKIKVTFVVPDGCSSEDDCSEDMLLAFKSCSQHCSGELQAQWAHESQWTKFDGLTRRDVFVLSEFKGHLYEKLKLTKCLLVGPRCLSCCLTEGAPIPSGPEPVYTVAMRGLVITASGLSKQQKEAIKKKVFWMGGIYSTVLSDETTHLVSNTVLSDKYIKSVEKGIPIMHESWVTAVWDASLKMNVTGSSPDFDIHRLPPFANLQVTTSGISKVEKQAITKLVNNNGGQFSGAFQSETTDIVVMLKESLGSEKHKAAVEYGKVCVLPSWVRDSAGRGAALPTSRYRVGGASTSSPLAEHRLPDMSLNFSRISNSRRTNYVDETRSADVTASTARTKASFESRKSDETSMDKDMVTAFENFNMSLLKKAGPIFDGFCIWVEGMEGVCRERVSGAVSRCGGVRYSCAHERVTHAVCARALAQATARAAPRALVLSPLWVLRSVEAGRALDEAPFLYDVEKESTPVKSRPRAEPESPMSKRNLQLLRPALNLPPPTPELDKPQEDIVHQYLSQNIAEVPREVTPERSTSAVEQPEIQPDLTDDMEDPTEEVEQIFRGIKMEVQGLEEEAVCEVGAEVAGAGGALVAAGAGGDYALVPLDFDPDELVNKYAQPVTVFWIKDCLAQQELVSVQYYHRPVTLPPGSSAAPLRGVVASLSTYTGVERAFLDELAKLLGATTQLRFCRRNTANALASTHLICPTPTGDKYLGAKKWGLPAVRGSWLLACVAAGRRVSEEEYLVGETRASLTPEKEERPVNIKTDKQVGVEKENASSPDPAEATVTRRGSVPNADQIKVDDCGNEMSPASRYIAMARQGLLGTDSQATPQRLELKQDKDQEVVRTPPLEEALSSPALGAFSVTTRHRLLAIKRGEVPSGPINTPQDPFQKKVETPGSAFGAALGGGEPLTPTARKRLWTVVNELPGKPPARDKQTPLSEIKNRFLAQFNNESWTPPSGHTAAPRKLHLQDAVETPPPKMAKLWEDHSVSRQQDMNANASSTSVSAHTSVDTSAHACAHTSVEEPQQQSVGGALPAEVDLQLQRLQAALDTRPGSQRRRTRGDSIPSLPQGPETEAGPESQPNTVGWDDAAPRARLRPDADADTAEPHLKKFMLSSNVDNREEIISMILELGGAVSESSELDLSATHLLCAAPGRSEKMLGSVAAGRWVLHPAYVPRSRAHGVFLPEEEYEWGNPSATCLPALSDGERVLACAAHRWRAVRQGGGAGPFVGMRALLHVPPPRRRLLAKLITAGGGDALDLEPPYTTEEMNVCFADTKRWPLSARDAAWVAARVPVCAPVLLSAFLTELAAPAPRDHCLPEFRHLLQHAQ